MTKIEIDNLAQRIGEFFHLFREYTLFEYGNTEKDVERRVEQLKHELTDIENIEEIIFEIYDCNKNLDDSHDDIACELINLLKEQRRFLERNENKTMVGDTNYEVKHAIHIGDKEIVFAEDETAKDGLCWFVGDHTNNGIIGQYTDCQINSDYLEAIKEFTDRVSRQIVMIKNESDRSNPPHSVFTAKHCLRNDYSQSIDGKIVAIKAEVLRPEYRRGDVQIVLVDGGNGAKANPNGRAVFCYHLNDGKRTRFERHDVQGEIIPEFIPKWAAEKAAEIQAQKISPPQIKPKDREDR